MNPVPLSSARSSRSTEHLAGFTFLLMLVVSVGVGLAYALIGRLVPSDEALSTVRGMLRAQSTVLGSLILLPTTLGLLTNLVLPAQLGATASQQRRWRVRFSVLCQIVGTASCFGSIALTGSRAAPALFGFAALVSSAGLAATSLECLGLFARRDGDELVAGPTVLARSLYVASVASLLSCAGLFLLYADRFAHGGLTRASTMPESPVFPAALLLVPAIGIVSDVLATFSKRRLAGERWLSVSLVGVAFVALATWALRWFAAETSARVAMWAAGPLYGTFGGLAVLSWLMTLRGAGARLEGPMVWAVAFIAQLTIGSLIGFVLLPGTGFGAAYSSPLEVTRSQYLFTGAPLFATVAGLFYWYPRFGGRGARGAPLGALLTFGGFQVALVAELLVGLFGVPLGVISGEGAVGAFVEAGGLVAVVVGLLLVGFDIISARGSGSSAMAEH